MNPFDSTIDAIRPLLESLGEGADKWVGQFDEGLNWPRGGPGDIIMGSDTAIELGHPRTESVASLLWTESAGKVNNGRITVIGPELDKIKGDQAPFAKITLVEGHGFTEDNAFERCQKMDELRFALHLKGHMLRALPQQSKEWSRISKQALNDGLSLGIIGNELIRAYLELDFITATEVLFITSSTDDVKQLRETGAKVQKITTALNRILDDPEMDCSSCDLSEVCDEIEGFRQLHSKTVDKSR